MYIETQKDTNFFQFVVKKDRSYGFDHLLSNLKITGVVKERIDKGGAYVYLLDIYSLPNRKELRESLNKAQRDFI